MHLGRDSRACEFGRTWSYSAGGLGRAAWLWFGRPSHWVRALYFYTRKRRLLTLVRVRIYLVLVTQCVNVVSY